MSARNTWAVELWRNCAPSLTGATDKNAPSSAPKFTPRFKTVKRLTYKHVYAGERVRYYAILLGAQEAKP